MLHPLVGPLSLAHSVVCAWAAEVPVQVRKILALEIDKIVRGALVGGAALKVYYYLISSYEQGCARMYI